LHARFTGLLEREHSWCGHEQLHPLPCPRPCARRSPRRSSSLSDCVGSSALFVFVCFSFFPSRTFLRLHARSVKAVSRGLNLGRVNLLVAPHAHPALLPRSYALRTPDGQWGPVHGALRQLHETACRPCQTRAAGVDVRRRRRFWRIGARKRARGIIPHNGMRGRHTRRRRRLQRGGASSKQVPVRTSLELGGHQRVALFSPLALVDFVCDPRSIHPGVDARGHVTRVPRPTQPPRRSQGGL
jgi:hypothetical protein